MSYPDFKDFLAARRYCAEKGLLGKVNLENPSQGRVIIVDKESPTIKPPKAKDKAPDGKRVEG